MCKSGLIPSPQVPSQIPRTVWLTRVCVKPAIPYVLHFRVPKGAIVREHFEKAREDQGQPFMQLAGKVSGPQNLSSRKGYSLK
jgi:hypothetical protein